MVAFVFAVRLKELREAAGLSQAELGERARITRVQVNRLESGKRSPNWSTVQALAKALGVKCDAFEDAPTPERKAARRQRD